jgi:hypothetical protein
MKLQVAGYDTKAPFEKRASRVANKKLSPATMQRKKFLNKLGIVDAQQTTAVPLNRAPSRGSLLGNVQVHHEPLKITQEKAAKEQRSNDNLFAALGQIFARVGALPPKSLVEGDQPSLASTSADSSLRSMDETECSLVRKVAFNEDVTVIPIPKRTEYSARIRAHLWDGADVLQANVFRNSIEFAADGYDVSRVLEEGDMIEDPESGELVHPIHLEIAKVIRQERGLPDDGDVESLLKTA